jgi:hypothetical protein
MGTLNLSADMGTSMRLDGEALTEVTAQPAASRVLNPILLAI